jgi:hypothetical protein
MPSGVGYSKTFLEKLALILVVGGYSPKQLLREFTDVCRGLEEPRRRLDPAYLNFVSDLPHVIAHWYSDPHYLDPEGSPVPLPLRAARGPSLTALIARALPREKPADVVEALLQVRGLQRRGAHFLPTDRQLNFRHQRLTALAHGLTALSGMLSTVLENISGPPQRTVLERAAINPRFPVSALPQFHRRLKRLGEEFLWGIDADMRREEATGRSARRTRLGVGVYAFEEPDYPRSPRIKRRAARARPLGRAR